MADGENGEEAHDVLESAEIKDDTGQKQEVVVASHHVLGTHQDEGQHGLPVVRPGFTHLKDGQYFRSTT